MKKTAKWILSVLLIICLVLFGLYYVKSQRSLDCTPPVISLEYKEISLSVWDEQDAYLNGVTAWDDVDGDVTELLVVEGVSAIDENDSVTITYAAFDRVGNVSKAQRTVRYTDYQRPRFALSKPLIFGSGYTVNLLNYIIASDPLDGDLSDRVKVALTGDASDMSEKGTHMVDLRVTNSMGDTARITVPVEICDYEEYNSSVILSDNLIYLKQGSVFAAENYLVELDVGTRKISLEQLIAEDADIDIRSNVDTNVLGTYHVDYTINYGSCVGFTRLIVVVED